MKQPINKIDAEDLELFVTKAAHGDAGLDHYQVLATQSAFYPGQGSALGLAYCALKLNGEAGELAEHVGKAMRDDGLMRAGDEWETGPIAYLGDLGAERRALIIKELGDVLWYVSAIAGELGLDLSDVALANLRKLADRGERGTLAGSGDNR